MGAFLFHPSLSSACSCFQMEINPVMIFNRMDASCEEIRLKTLTACVALVEMCVDKQVEIIKSFSEVSTQAGCPLSLCLFLFVSLIDGIENQTHSWSPTRFSPAVSLHTYQ